MTEIILITGQDCPLCQEAREKLNSLNLYDLTLLEKDGYATREIHNKYWNKIPVLLKEDRDLCWPFNSEEIKEFILS